MIREVTIRRFKRFDDVTFSLNGHIVVAGPNNAGKTTLLQALAAWNLALLRWKQLHDYQRHGGAYTRAPLARQAFYAVPLRSFDSLWGDRNYQGAIEIAVKSTEGWNVTMELLPDSTEQIYVRPKPDADPATVKGVDLRAVFVPSMTGLSIEEPVYQPAKIQQLLGLGKPGDVLRNLLVEAHQRGAWNALCDSMQRLFGIELLPPDSSLADIVAEYRRGPGSPKFDITSAGSGLQQVLLLLTFLHTQSGGVLLLDEPDAHLHVILQDAIYGELRDVAAARNSQLIIATHSEIIINSVEPDKLCSLFGPPRMLASTMDRKRLGEALSILTHNDIILAQASPGVLYVENYPDLHILREWARVLGHPVYKLLSNPFLWKPTVIQNRPDAKGVKSREHYEALQWVRPDLPALELLDGDNDPRIPETPITGSGFQRLRWRRYEIESYLVHPAALARFVEQVLGAGAASAQARQDLLAYLQTTFTPIFLTNPLDPNPLIDAYFKTTKARTDILPPALAAAGIHGFDYTRFHEIAALMKPEEIHPEVKEKLDAIQKAFNL